MAPDGVCIRIDWGQFAVGTSVFVPCINAAECVRQFNHIASDNKWGWEYRVRIENKCLGVRFWRTA